MERWSGKIAVVTGASSGIGEAIAKALVQEGVHVVALARREEKLKELAKTVKGSKGTLHPVRCDIRNEEDILRAFQYAEEKFGGVDILVNNAGIGHFEPLSESSTENMRSILEVNVLAPAITAREAIKSIRRRGGEGHVININSILGRYLPEGIRFSLYGASKFALHAMTENLRQEIAGRKDNIKVTGIYPGLVKTEIIEVSGGDEQIFDKRPYVKSEDIADSVLFALRAHGNVQLNEVMVTPLHQ